MLLIQNILSTRRLFFCMVFLALTVPNIGTGTNLMVIESEAQIGSMSTLQNTPTTYAVSIIPGAAQRDSPYHYYPPAINVPIGTTVGWFNNDLGQPHTVTSGAPDASDAGTIFNSGVLSATSNSFFQYTFDNPGNYIYHCIIHPWRQAIVSVADSYERGHYFEMSSGVGQVLNLTTDFRTLFDFQPLTIPLDKTTPLTYNITIAKNANTTVFSDTFVTDGESLPLELIKSNANETLVYGPDFSSTGAYHVEAPFLSGDSEYTITAELVSINSKVPESIIKDEFSFKTVT
jgi:plastocyanin